MTTMTTDRAGFPMIWVEAIDAYVHWLPVSKVQFEYFLCSATDSRFDDRWYDQILELNPRISPGGIRVRNYWKAFLTGILPDEAQRYARWCGEEYQVPSLEEWFEAYRALKDQDPRDIDWQDQLPGMKPRTVKIVDQMEKSSTAVAKNMGFSRSLADQMMMRCGVMEWVELQSGGKNWGGMGELLPDFHGLLFRPDHGQPTLPRNPETERVFYFGFRLIRRSE